MNTDLSQPQTIIRWICGRRYEVTATPTPFGPARAKEIYAQREVQNEVSTKMTDGEWAYVMAVQKTLGGNSSWQLAFYAIMNGEFEKK